MKPFISVSELAKMLAPPLLVDCDTQEAYEEGHLPGAFLAPCRYWKKGACDSGVHAIEDPRELSKLTAPWGLAKGTAVVAYDRSRGLNAARLAWTLERFGFPNCRVLDGGLQAWCGSGHPVSREHPLAQSGGLSFEKASDRSLARIGEWTGSESLLWDNRSQRERESGFIPGSLHLEWDKVFAEDGRLLPENALRELLVSKVGEIEREVVIYCLGGIRAAHSYWVLKSLGYDKVRVYDGSWAEYGPSGLPIDRP